MQFEQEFQQITQLREAGNFLEALQALVPVLNSAIQEKATHHLVAVGMERALIFRHLYLQTNEDMYLHFAQSALTEVEPFVDDSQQGSFSFWQAQILFSQKQYSQAVERYEKALAVFQDMPASGNYVYHLGVATFCAGEKERGLALVKEGIASLQAHESELDPYSYHVWLSGAYLRCAQLLAVEGDVQSARAALEQAAAVIGQRSDLVLRQQHLEKTRLFIENATQQPGLPF